MEKDSLTAKKLKIVWICHFMNQSIKEKLRIPYAVKELAPWITLGVDEFKKRNDIDLHLIAPLVHICNSTIIVEGNITYHFVKIGRPLSRKPWPNWFNLDVLLNYMPFNLQVIRLIKRIQPDLVNLIGAENAYYSSSVLKIKNYPILVTIQGFVSLNNELEGGNTKVVKRRILIEEEIMRKMKHFGVEATSIESYIRAYNPEAKMHWFHFPFAKTNVDTDHTKEYDIVFFARITKMKGIEDAIRALSIAKHYKPDIKMEVIGNADQGYMDSLRELVQELDLTKNIEFRGFLTTQKEMHNEAIKARISILPTYNDTIPGTIVESMLLGLPVISYRTGGIPDLNKDDENIILVEQGNISGLAEEIIKILEDPEKQSAMSNKVKTFALTRFDNTNSTDMLVKAYKEVINDYQQ